MKIIVFGTLCCLLAVILALKRRIGPAIAFGLFVPLMHSSLLLQLGEFNVFFSDILISFLLPIAFLRRREQITLRAADVFPTLLGFWIALCVFAAGAGFTQGFKTLFRWSIPWGAAYWIARFSFNCPAQWVRFWKVMGVFFAICAILSLIEGLGIWYCYDWLVGGGVRPDTKYGFHRARVFFRHPILYGVFAMIVTCQVIGISKLIRAPRRYLWHIVLALCLLGVITSTSSTAYVGTFIAILFVLLFPLRRFLPFGIGLFVAGNIAVDLLSNRRVWHVWASYSGSPATGYYRSELIERIFSIMPGHWLMGYGEQVLPLPRLFHDLCNDFIFVLAKGGLPAFLGYFAFYSLLFYYVYKAYKLCASPKEQFVVWASAGFLIGNFFCMFGVSPYGQARPLMSFLYGMIVSLPEILRMRKKAPERTQRLGQRLQGRRYASLSDPHRHLDLNLPRERRMLQE